MGIFSKKIKPRTVVLPRPCGVAIQGSHTSQVSPKHRIETLLAAMSAELLYDVTIDLMGGTLVNTA